MIFKYLHIVQDTIVVVLAFKMDMRSDSVPGNCFDANVFHDCGGSDACVS